MTSLSQESSTVPKIFRALALAGVVALSVSALAACSSSTTASCTPTKAGASSDKVKVSGKVGAAPKVTFSKGISAKTTQRTVNVTGSGKVAAKGSKVTVDYTAYNAASGKKIDATGYTSKTTQSFTLTKDGLLPGLYKALLCAPTGSRVTAVIPPADAFKTAGQSDLGIGAKDNLIFVFDVDKVTSVPKTLKKANGTAQAAPKGYPTVKLAASGEPTLTIPKTAAPKTLMIADLKKGSGATVKATDGVIVQYIGALWDSGKVFNNSWTSGGPVTFAANGVIPGFSKALVGHKVGSQVIAVIPPADGYGATPPSGSGIAATDTLVFVVDILGTK
jgi:FKBP-type peptidyl-prolyl cis-trans isomerase